jgi:hypothetical protein
MTMPKKTVMTMTTTATLALAAILGAAPSLAADANAAAAAGDARVETPAPDGKARIVFYRPPVAGRLARGAVPSIGRAMLTIDARPAALLYRAESAPVLVSPGVHTVTQTWVEMPNTIGNMPQLAIEQVTTMTVDVRAGSVHYLSLYTYPAFTPATAFSPNPLLAAWRLAEVPFAEAAEDLDNCGEFSEIDLSR